jgi:hypothetical protein
VLLGRNRDLKGAILWMKRYLEAASRDDGPRVDEARRLLEEWERALKPLGP